jgi:peptidoglycan-N-acetylglucosamine deacetylase
VLAKTVKRAIDGKPFAWDKLERTAAVTKNRIPATPSPGPN